MTLYIYDSAGNKVAATDAQKTAARADLGAASSTDLNAVASTANAASSAAASAQSAASAAQSAATAAGSAAAAAQATASAAYVKPDGGIPHNDLHQGIREQLDLAESALQPGALPAGTTVTAAQVSDASAAGRSVLTAADEAEQRTALGLGSVDNTADADKPVSTAQATALATKMNATMPALQSVFDGGTAAQKAAFSASVSGYPALNWLRSLRLRNIYQENSGTVTFGGTTSVLNGGVNGAVNVSPLSADLTYNCKIANDGYRTYAANVTSVDSSVNNVNTPMIVAFDTDEPRVEMAVRGTGLADVTAWVSDPVNGTTVFPRSRAGALPNNGSTLNILFSLDAANTVNYAVANIVKLAAGTGYAVGDQITISAGAAATPAVVQVTQVSSGAIAQIMLINPGSYTAAPSATATQLSTTGAGTGATFTVTPGASHTTRRMRTWYFCMHGAASKLNGFNIPTAGKFQKTPARTGRKIVIVGDSQSAGTYLTRPAGHWGITFAQHLGVLEQMPEINAAGGTGYETANTSVSPNLGAWSSALRIADFIAAAGDIYLWVGTQNDNGASTTLQQKVVDTVGAVAAALPNSIHIGFSSVLNNGSQAAMAATHTAAFAALAATYPGRVFFHDNIASGWFSGAGKIGTPAGTGNNDYYLSGDGAHYCQAGIDYFARKVAEVVATI